jgi:hypothetical protein
MVSIAYLYFSLLLVIIRKCEKTSSKKNTKKMEFSFSRFYFIFRKWTKIIVQKSFKKKSFKKRGSFAFFIHCFYKKIIKTSPRFLFWKLKSKKMRIKLLFFILLIEPYVHSPFHHQFYGIMIYLSISLQIGK